MNLNIRTILIFSVLIIILVIIVGLAFFIFSPKRKLWNNPKIIMILSGLVGLGATGGFGSGRTSIFRQSTKSIAESAINDGNISAWIIWILLYIIWLGVSYRLIFNK